MTFAVAGLNLLLGLMTLSTGLSSGEELEREYDVRASTLIGASFFFLAHGGVGAGLGWLFARGGNGVRVGTTVWAVFAVFLGMLSAPVGLVSVLLAALVVVFLAQAPARAWFSRARS